MHVSVIWRDSRSLPARVLDLVPVLVASSHIALLTCLFVWLCAGGDSEVEADDLSHTTAVGGRQGNRRPRSFSDVSCCSLSASVSSLLLVLLPLAVMPLAVITV